MRGLIDQARNPSPLGARLPGIFQSDDFVRRFLSGFDDCLAPILHTLDNLHAYVDPRLTPTDFLRWLAGWLAVSLDENWPADRQRRLIAEAAELYRWHGTTRGIARQIELYLGITPEIEDTGGVSIGEADSPPPEAEPKVTIRLRVPDPNAVDTSRLDAMITAIKPVHVIHEVEVITA